MSTIRFFYNGLKAGNGKLEKAHYSFANFHDKNNKGITVHAKDYAAFSDEIRKAFIVKNDSDIQTDYIVTDNFTIPENSKYYIDALEAVKTQEEKKLAKYNKMLEQYKKTYSADNSYIKNTIGDIEWLKKEIAEIENIINSRR